MKYVSLACLAVVCACLFFIGLGRLPLLEPDEGRNAEVAREMLESRDWVTPHYDQLTYLDKPACFFWMVAGSFRCFKVSEWSARFPSAVLALATALLMWEMARRMSGREIGLLAGIIFAVSPLVLGFARFVIFDIPLTFFVAVAMYCLWLGSESGFRRVWPDVGAFAAMGVATLIKGPVGFLLPLLTVVIYQALRRKLADLRKLHWAFAAIVFLALTLPWFIEVCLRNPGFARYAFWNESLRRYFSGVHVHRSEGFWYYIPVYLVGFFPWSFFLLFAVWNRRRRWRAIWTERRSAELFLLTWFGVVFVFFSISGSKLPGYFLPAIVPLSILMAIIWPSAEDAPLTGAPDWLTGGFALMMLAGLVMASVQFLPLHHIQARLSQKLPPSMLSQFRPAFFLGGVILLALGFLGRNRAARLRRRWARSLTFAVAAVTIPLLAVRSRGPLASYFNAFSSRRLAQTILRSPERNLTVYGYYYFRTSLPFYLGRPVGLVTADGDELTSNYVVARFKEARGVKLRFRGLQGDGEGRESSGRGRPNVVSHSIFDNRSLTAAAQNQSFRAARVSKRYVGRHTSDELTRWVPVASPAVSAFRPEPVGLIVPAFWPAGPVRWGWGTDEADGVQITRTESGFASGRAQPFRTAGGKAACGLRTSGRNLDRSPDEADAAKAQADAPGVNEPVLLTGAELRMLSQTGPGPFLVLVPNKEVDQLAGAAGSIQPLWVAWHYSVWEKVPKAVTSDK